MKKNEPILMAYGVVSIILGYICSRHYTFLINLLIIGFVYVGVQMSKTAINEGAGTGANIALILNYIGGAVYLILSAITILSK
ncbi:MAG: hypothetical protein J1E61_03205 [Lachnospiraceae bacterium]|nr:hypothetical protein [Lachnospiraceae bacterium]